jgi:2-dehydropantoate 2-reductase
MKICVFGAGAIGSHMAVLLARAGAQMSVLVRGAQLEAIRARGLELHLDQNVLHADVQASDDPSQLGPQDAVLVTVKSPALGAAAQSIAALLGPETPAVFLQNGIPWWYYHGHGGASEGRRLPAIDPGDALWNSVGPQRAMGGVTSSPCTMLAPGVVKVTGGNRPMTLGEPDGSLSPRLRALEEVFRAAGFPVQATPRIRDAIWSKLALNLGSGPMSVLIPLPLKTLYTEPACIEARLRVLDEVAAIAKAMGCPITVDHGMEFPRNSPHVPSIGQDMQAGRKLEIETMFQAPLQMARECGVPTPTLDLLVAMATLKARDAGLYP